MRVVAVGFIDSVSVFVCICGVTPKARLIVTVEKFHMIAIFLQLFKQFIQRSTPLQSGLNFKENPFNAV